MVQQETDKVKRQIKLSDISVIKTLKMQQFGENSIFVRLPVPEIPVCTILYFPCMRIWLPNVPFRLFKSEPKFCADHLAIMKHISASTALIRMKQKPLYSKLNAESDKYYYNSLCKSFGNPPESLIQKILVKGFGTRSVLAVIRMVGGKKCFRSLYTSASTHELHVRICESEEQFHRKIFEIQLGFKHKSFWN